MDDRQLEYEEVFERSGYDTEEQAMYKIRSVLEEHPQDLGWEHGEPEILRDDEGKYKISIPLAKYAVEERGYSK